MGSTFSNISLRKGPGLTREAVSECLTSILLSKGFRCADEASADISFAVYSLPSSQWYTVCESAMLFEDANEQLAIAGRLSTELKSDALRISCFDSDYLFLNLINPQENLDAWASVGSSAGLGIRRRTGFSHWKSRISDINRFQQAIKKQYVFAEEVLEKLAGELELPAKQSYSDFDDISETLPKDMVTYLHFSMPVTESAPSVPVFDHFIYSLSPCISGRPMTVNCINRGGAGKGIEVFLFGESIASGEVEFTEVTMARTNRIGVQEHTPMTLEKRQMPDGSMGYYGIAKAFRIPEKVSPTLPLDVRVKKEADLAFWFRCVPQSEDTEPLELTVLVRPVQNPDGGVAWSSPDH